MKTVFILWHSYELEGEEESKLIGVYASHEAAEQAKVRTVSLPGFVDHPNDFIIDEYEIGKDEWTSGFVRMIGLEEAPRSSTKLP